MTQEELENISTEYGDKLLEERLKINIKENDPLEKYRYKCIKLYSTYDIESAFEDGVNYAISKLCNK